MFRGSLPKLVLNLNFSQKLSDGYVSRLKDIATHRISPQLGPKQYFFHRKPKLQLRLPSLGVYRGGYFSIMFRSSLPKLVSNLNFSQKLSDGYVFRLKDIATHKTSPQLGPKQYFFHRKPKLQLRLPSLGVYRGGYFSIMFRGSLPKLVSNLNFSQKLIVGWLYAPSEEHMTTHKITNSGEILLIRRCMCTVVRSKNLF